MRNDSLFLSCEVGEKFESVTLRCFARHNDIPSEFFYDSPESLIPSANDFYTSPNEVLYSWFSFSNNSGSPGPINQETMDNTVFIPFVHDFNGGSGAQILL